MTASGQQASDLVSAYSQLLRRSVATPQVAVSVLSETLPPRDNRPCALLLTPHPDDECLTGGLPLRLKREQGWRIVNLAVTLGGDLDRRAARAQELAGACATLGFEAVLAAAQGFSGVKAAAREDNPKMWAIMAARVAEAITHLRPKAIFMPHAMDGHPTHGGTHLLGFDALSMLGRDYSCAVFMTEYWQPLSVPNLMVGLAEADVATILSALACHTGEVARNPYDVRFPAYLIDNVRRGGERVGGIGSGAPAMDFAMLYQYGQWRMGKYASSALPRLIAATDKLDEFVSLI